MVCAMIALDNLVLLPHIASATRETRKANFVLGNIERFVASGEMSRRSRLETETQSGENGVDLRIELRWLISASPAAAR